jgi:hypothetical protein
MFSGMDKATGGGGNSINVKALGDLERVTTFISLFAWKN